MKKVADPAKAKETIASGGLPTGITEPPESAPHWIRLQWKAEMERMDLIRAKKLAEASRKRKIQKTRSQDQWVKRKQRDRRNHVTPVPGRDRRKAFDRRGRGY